MRSHYSHLLWCWIKRNLFWCLYFLVLLVALTSMDSHAWPQRNVHINGMNLSDQQVRALEHQLGTHIRDGHYWVNMHSGYWGYKGNPIPQGRINMGRGDNYSGSIHRGPGGTTGSDGRCFYYNDPSTGSSVMSGCN